MKLFIDSAKIDEIREADSYGVLDGVTTNPSLLKKAVEELKKSGKKVNMDSYIKQILKLLGPRRPVSLEVIGHDFDSMTLEGVRLYRRYNGVARNVVIKIPVNPSMSMDSTTDFDGIKAIKFLSKRKIPVNCTLIFTPEQALMAAKAGAKFVSPFAGRVDDLKRKGKKFDKSDYYPVDGVKGSEDNGVVSGVDLVAQIVEIFENYGMKCEVLAASIRNSRQLRECALVGADIATVPLGVIKETMVHEKTVEGMKGFSKDVVPEYARLLGRK
jgi:transaldolase